MDNKRNSSSRRGADTVLCRACLADCRPQQTKFLFGKWQPPTKSPVTDASDITIADMLCDVTNTTVKQGDKYPDHICSTCFQHFWAARTFIHRVRQSDKIMRKNWKYFQANHKKAPSPAPVNESKLDRSVTRNTLTRRARSEALEKNDTNETNNQTVETKIVKDKTNNDAEETKNDTDKTKNKSEKIKSKISISDHLTQLVKQSPVVVLEKLMLDELKKEKDWEIKEEIDIKNEVLSDTENDSSFQNLNQSDNGFDMSTEIKLEEPDETSQEEKDVLREYPRIVATQGADVFMQTRASKKHPSNNKDPDSNKKLLRSHTKKQSTDEKLRGGDEEQLASDENQHDTNTLLVKTGEVPVQLREGREWTDMHETYVKEELDEDDVDIDLVCILCSKSFMTIAGLKAHVISTHTYKWAVRVDALREQLRSKTVLSATDAPPLHCKICSKAFQTSEQLKVHMESHIQRAREIAADKKGAGRNGRARATACKSTAGGGFHCVGCNLRLPTYKLLLLHAATCRKRLQLMGRITNKTSNVDKRTDDNTNNSTPSRPKENSEDSTEEDGKMDIKKSYECKECKQTFDGSLYLKIHNEIHHTALNGDADEDEDHNGTAVTDPTPAPTVAATATPMEE